MKEEADAYSDPYRGYYQQYSSQSYQKKQYVIASNQRWTGSDIPQKEVRQSAKQSNYSINNLPIIYDSNRNSTPRRTSGSSRVMYMQKQPEKTGPSSPVVKYDGLQFNQARPEVQRYSGASRNVQEFKQKQIESNFSTVGIKNKPSIPDSLNTNQTGSSSSNSRTLIATLSESSPVDNNYKVQSSYQPQSMKTAQKYQYKPTVGDKQKSSSRLIIQKQLANGLNYGIPSGLQPVPPGMPVHIPPQFSGKSVTSYIVSQIQYDPIPGPEIQIQTDVNHISSYPSPSAPVSYNSMGISRPAGSPSFTNTPPPQLNFAIPRQIGSTLTKRTESNSNSQLITKQRQMPMGPQAVYEPEVVNYRPLSPTIAQANTKMNSESSLSISPRPIPMPMGVSHLSAETVPKIQFDKCVTQCKNWQTKYNELYLKYMSLATSSLQTSTAELQNLRQQNYKLRRQLKQEQDKNTHLMPMLQSKFSQMVNNQRQATIRQCTLLMQRFKLQSKHNKF